ncbi:hypothetical protein G7Y89_g14489 [Cudoniella acicularis]|uniref:Uncharacterized protein n=1 Tax=Cudoniella acicularis TaxID=354080 RepID=A0A8H4VTA9_9HELO|nr:hypothetical protein G7Y89_g14489 [Cudoniella acicularis]
MKRRAFSPLTPENSRSAYTRANADSLVGSLREKVYSATGNVPLSEFGINEAFQRLTVGGRDLGPIKELGECASGGAVPFQWLEMAIKKAYVQTRNDFDKEQPGDKDRMAPVPQIGVDGYAKAYFGDHQERKQHNEDGEDREYKDTSLQRRKFTTR